jgi:sporulation protein YlmC with PRC-barrel domain
MQFASLTNMITDASLHGRVVLSGDGVSIGEVVHLLVDPSDWHIGAVEVKLRNEVADRIGAHHGLLRSAVIGIPTEQIQSIGDAIILGVSIDEIRPLRPEPSA